MDKEIDIKHTRLRDYLNLKNLKGILVSRQTIFYGLLAATTKGEDP